MVLDFKAHIIVTADLKRKMWVPPRHYPPTSDCTVVGFAVATNAPLATWLRALAEPRKGRTRRLAVLQRSGGVPIATFHNETK